MTWARHASTTSKDPDRFAVVQAAYKLTCEAQGRRAALVVAGHSADATDCAELLAMLGLDTVSRTPAPE
ncbi:MAG: hypothetical protein H0W01_16410 [Pseudonocardiales bacterium]|nr:hypothetical protein [Pseudonocardiales bacterium]